MPKNIQKQTEKKVAAEGAAPRRGKRPASPPEGPDPELPFETADAWARWLTTHHATSTGLWIVLAKKGSGRPSVSYAEAIDVALCWGWIDGQRRPKDDATFLQRFTPRRPRSPWSKINRDKATALIAAGKMKAPGLAQVEAAKADGRWAAAYDSPRTAQVPDDLAAALATNRKAAAFFATLHGTNRYAILYRIQTAKKPETRARRIATFVAMLARHETVYG